jgi:hypothetical protein
LPTYRRPASDSLSFAKACGVRVGPGGHRGAGDGDGAGDEAGDDEEEEDGVPRSHGQHILHELQYKIVKG